MSYILYRNDQSEFTIDVTELKNKLLLRWPFIEFGDKVKDFTDFSWRLKDGVIDQFCTVLTSKGSINIDDYHEGVSKFAIWYKNAVLPNHRLFVSHDSSAFEVEIFNDMEEENLVRLLDENI